MSFFSPSLSFLHPRPKSCCLARSEKGGKERKILRNPTANQAKNIIMKLLLSYYFPSIIKSWTFNLTFQTRFFCCAKRKRKKSNTQLFFLIAEDFFSTEKWVSEFEGEGDGENVRSHGWLLSACQQVWHWVNSKVICKSGNCEMKCEKDSQKFFFIPGEFQSWSRTF